MDSIEPKTCLACNSEISGRSDKKYCDQYCKSNYQYQKIKADNSSMMHKITKQLRLNRKILKQHNKIGKTTVRAAELKKLGFNPRVFTHYWKAKNKNTYLFVFDYGFLSIQEKGHKKIIIVQWQSYMNKQIGSLNL